MAEPLDPPPTPLRIAGTGQYLPERRVTSDEVDQLTGMPSGWTQRHTGVTERRYAAHETTAGMGAAALRDAFSRASWGEGVPDLLLNAGCGPHQPIPCTASIIAAELGWNGVACFDVNATCLGFVAALQVAAGLIAAGTHKRIAIVCSEVASGGLNWKQAEAAGLMGDGAAAVLLERDETGGAVLLRTSLETWPEGVSLTEIRGGGTTLHPQQHVPGMNTDEYLFHMDGPSVFRLAAEKMEPFVSRLVGKDAGRWSSVDWVVPHQASLPAVRHLRRRLGIPSEKLIETIQHQGNAIAASIPLALHEGIVSGRIQRGQTILLLGTSAGFSIGGALLRY